MAKMTIARTLEDADAAWASMNPEERRHIEELHDRGVDPIHATNVVRSRRRQTAAFNSVEDPEATIDEAVAIGAGNAATFGGVPTIAAALGHGEGDTFADRKQDNNASLEKVRESQPMASATGELAGLVAPGLASLPRAALSSAGVKMAAPTIAQGARAGGVLGAAGNMLNTDTGEDLGARALVGGVGGAATGGLLSAAPQIAARIAPSLNQPIRQAFTAEVPTITEMMAPKTAPAVAEAAPGILERIKAVVADKGGLKNVAQQRAADVARPVVGKDIASAIAPPKPTAPAPQGSGIPFKPATSTSTTDRLPQIQAILSDAPPPTITLPAPKLPDMLERVQAIAAEPMPANPLSVTPVPPMPKWGQTTQLAPASSGNPQYDAQVAAMTTQKMQPYVGSAREMHNTSKWMAKGRQERPDGPRGRQRASAPFEGKSGGASDGPKGRQRAAEPFTKDLPAMTMSPDPAPPLHSWGQRPTADISVVNEAGAKMVAETISTLPPSAQQEVLRRVAAGSGDDIAAAVAQMAGL